MKFNGSALCWDAANEACSINGTDRDYSSILAMLYTIYLLLVNTGINAKLINHATGGKYTDTVSKFVFKQIFWLHGVATFVIMKLAQPHNLRLVANCLDNLLGLTNYIGSDVGLSTLKYSLQSVLAFILWDLLVVSKEPIRRQVLINCHHLGLFIAMYFGKGWDISSTDANLKSQVNLDSSLYGYMWSIHSFGFILAYIFPLVGIRLQDGERSKLLDNIKYAYSSGTVYWYNWYFNADGQPGVGINYQTLSLLTMLCGRFGLNLNVPFLRRVEMPGMFIILVDGLFFKDAYLQRSIGVSLSMLVAWSIHYCYIKKHTPKPAEFFGPNENDKLKAFLEAETSAVHNKEEDPNKESSKLMVQGWFETNKIDPKKHNLEKKKVANGNQKGGNKLDPHSFAYCYPLHYAVAMDDAELVEQMLQSKDVDANEPLLEHHDTTPLQIASFLVSTFGYGSKVLLVLLKNGGNPYIKRLVEGDDCVDAQFNMPLGGSRDFFRRYNEICLERSPAKLAFADLPLIEKIRLLPL